MTPPTACLIADADTGGLLPARWGLLLVYAAFGFLGGGMAMLNRQASASLRQIVVRGIIGVGTSMMTAPAFMAKFGTDDAAIWLTICISTGSGFVGPVAAIRWLETRRGESKP